MNDTACECLQAPLPADQYQRQGFLGVDETHGRFGEVELWRCQRCGRLWLYYYVSYEAFSRSGRFFMGLISAEQAERLHPQDAVPYLEQLDWYLFGGSYFDGLQGRSSGRVAADL